MSVSDKFIFNKRSGECRNPHEIFCPIDNGYGYAILTAQNADGEWVYGYDVECGEQRVTHPCYGSGYLRSHTYDTEDKAVSAAAGQVAKTLRRFKGGCGNVMALVEMQDAAEELMVLDEYKD